MNVVSFARLCSSCKWINELIMENAKRISIHPSNNATHLFLSVKIHYCVGFHGPQPIKLLLEMLNRTGCLARSETIIFHWGMSGWEFWKLFSLLRDKLSSSILRVEWNWTWNPGTADPIRYASSQSGPELAHSSQLVSVVSQFCTIFKNPTIERIFRIAFYSKSSWNCL